MNELHLNLATELCTLVSEDEFGDGLVAHVG